MSFGIGKKIIERKGFEKGQAELMTKIKNHIKANAGHIDINNCSSYEQGYYDAYVQLLEYLQIHPLEELLIPTSRQV